MVIEQIIKEYKDYSGWAEMIGTWGYHPRMV